MSVPDFVDDEPQEEYESWEEERLALTESIQSIDAQLGNRNRIDPETGRRMDDKQWWEWRTKATTAKKYLLVRLREVKEEIRLENVAKDHGHQSTIIAKLDSLLSGQERIEALLVALLSEEE